MAPSEENPPPPLSVIKLSWCESICPDEIQLTKLDMPPNIFGGANMHIVYLTACMPIYSTGTKYENALEN